MGRKPYKKIKLTTEEYDVVQSIAYQTHCDWFSIAGDTVELVTGKVANKVRHADYDECYCWETKHYISLQYGLKVLGESFGDLNLLDLTEDEKKIWLNLLERIK